MVYPFHFDAACGCHKVAYLFILINLMGHLYSFNFDCAQIRRRIQEFYCLRTRSLGVVVEPQQGVLLELLAELNCTALLMIGRIADI